MQQWTRIKEDDAAGDLALALAVDAELSASSGRKPAPPQANPNKFERRCHGTGGN